MSQRPKNQVSSDGGHRPIFRPDGRALYFVGPGLRVYETPLSLLAGEHVPGRPSLMSAIDTVGFLGYDGAPDGRILVLRRVSGGLDSFRVLLGWRERVEPEEAGDAVGQQ